MSYLKCSVNSMLHNSNCSGTFVLTVFMNLLFEKVSLINLVALTAHHIPTLTSCSGTLYIRLGLSADRYLILSVNLAI